MEFRIELGNDMPDVGVIDDLLRTLDPAALIDFDQGTRVLRVGAAVRAIDLVRLLEQAGYPVTRQQVTQLPSVCCGGCSG